MHMIVMKGKDDGVLMLKLFLGLKGDDERLSRWHNWEWKEGAWRIVIIGKQKEWEETAEKQCGRA